MEDVGYRLGKAPPVLDRRTLKLARYFAPATLPPLPDLLIQGTLESWPMLGNDRYGDCTVVSASHLEMTQAAALKRTFLPSERRTLKAYSELTGFNRRDPATDNGAAMLDVLNYWRHVGIHGRKADVYAALDPQDPNDYRYAALLTVGAYVGLNLPRSARAQIGGTWDGDGSDAGGWGGHAVAGVGYNLTGPLVVTWGRIQQLTWRFFQAYCDEAYAVIPRLWRGRLMFEAVGLRHADLLADLKAIGQVAP